MRLVKTKRHPNPEALWSFRREERYVNARAYIEHNGAEFIFCTAAMPVPKDEPDETYERAADEKLEEIAALLYELGVEGVPDEYSHLKGGE